MENLYNICWYLIAQTQVGKTAEKANEVGEEVAKQPGFFDSLSFMFPAFIAVMLLYFVMTAKPQAKGQAKTSEILANLKKNDRVVTAGGI
ncbi:MAG: preprotein translocase subunit YajC, partial [Planctomycetota bacterium]